MAAFVHLNCRHSFNTGRQIDLPNTEYLIPETSLYEVLQVQRRRLVQWCQPVPATATSTRATLQVELSAALKKLRMLGAEEQVVAEDIDARSIALCTTVASINAQLQTLPATPAAELASGIATPAQLNEVMTTVQVCEL